VLLAAACLALLVTAATPVVAQSQGDLRRANEQLRQEVEELRAQVERLQSQLREAEAAGAGLRERIAELEAAAATAAGEPETTPGDPADSTAPDEDRPVITIDETRPDASPRAVRAEARRRWEAGPGSLELGADAASPQRINYLRVLEPWVREQERTWRLPVRWVVEPTGPGRTDRSGTTWTMQARDPITDAVIGRPFEVHARRSVVRGLEREIARAADEGRPTDRLQLFGDTVVRFTIDPRRREPGTFDRPPLLAPFLTFEFGVEANDLSVPRPRVGLGGGENDGKGEGKGEGDGSAG